MELLFTLDEKNYTNDMPIFERYGVRAIIKQNHKFAMQQGNSGEYKMPGGGVEHGESFHQALIREVREETGLLVKPETIKEIGEVLEIRADIKNKGYKYKRNQTRKSDKLRRKLQSNSGTENCYNSNRICRWFLAIEWTRALCCKDQRTVCADSW